MQQPDTWDTKVGERGLKLSGGEKQRIAIARTLLKNPPVVVLDEATSALDSVTEKDLQHALVTLGESRTMLIIAHRLTTIKHANQIIVLKDGKVKEVGTHNELVAKEGVYHGLWNVQKAIAQEEMDMQQEQGAGAESDATAAAAASTEVSLIK